MLGTNSIKISWASVRLVVIYIAVLLVCALCQSPYETIPFDPNEERDTSCEVHTYNMTCCAENEFQCANGQCIQSVKLCDGKMDCGDRSDEDECLTTSCARRLHERCEHNCMDLTENRSRCTCFQGFAYNRRDEQCKDINECAIGVHWCSQDCENLNGTFSCKCKDGFKLDPFDGSSGICIAKDTNIQILYSSDSWIYSYSVEKHKVEPVVHSGKVDEMDLDPLTNMVYWSTRHKVGRSYLPGAMNGSVTIGFPQTIGASSVWHIKTSLAIDWTAKNMYWISVDILNIDKYQILVSKLDGRYVKTIVSDVMNAKSLVVDPEQGKMYWTSGGLKAGISTAWMNGMYPKTLISIMPGSNPTALTLDHMSSGRIYWSESKSNSIYSAFTDGSRPNKIITLSSQMMPLMMDVFENSLYWVTGETKELVMHDKFGRGKHTPLVQKLINQTAVKVYHPRRVNVYIRQEALYCREQCSHLCFHVPKGYSCSCPDGSRLLLHQGEILCDREKEEALEDPLICDCTNKEMLCNVTSPQFKCQCPGVKCSPDEDRSSITTPSFDYDFSTEDYIYDHNTSNDTYTSREMINLYFFLIVITPILICFGLSFCKRPERNRSDPQNDIMSTSMGFNSEQDSVEQGFAQGGATIVKSGRGFATRNNGVDNPSFQDEEDSGLGYMSTTQLLVP